jgi:cysteine desulfurase
MRTAYLDHNATTPVLPDIFEAMQPYFTEKFSNPSALYRRGRDGHVALKLARESVARLLGCRAPEIVFTGGGTEGDNLAILGVASAGDHVITSAIEHSAVLNSCAYLEGVGVEVTRVPVDGQGQVDPQDVRRALRANTKLITIMMANNETGVLQPVEQIGAIAAEADVYFHVDAVQAAGKVPICVDQIGCDLLTISGHKIYAQQGTGALFIRRGTRLKPLLHGGHQEEGRRPGTENLPGIVGLGHASELALSGLQDGEQLGKWRDTLEAGVLNSIEAVGLNGSGSPRVPNTSNIYFDYITGEALLVALDDKGVAVSAGAACSAGAREPSHVLLAMGLSNERARSSLRFSLGKLNSADDIAYVLAVLPEVVRQLRKRSPIYRRATAATKY